MRRIFRSLFARAHRHVSPKSLSANRRRQLRLSSLEDRAVPATFTVNLTTDASGTAAGTGTGATGDLRYCIEQADLAAGADSIVFDKTVFTADTTITLNTTVGQLIADGDLTINNDTGKSITLDGSSATRLLRLNKVGTTTAYTINSLNFVNGSSTVDGGAILAATNDNAAASNMSAVTVTFNNCKISNSTSLTQGGGIALGNRITLNMFDSTVSGNSAPTTGPGGTGGTGGGVYASAFGTVHIERSTLSGNLSGGGNGGGALYFYGGLATDKVEIINSTISGNSAFNFGGAVALYALKNGGSFLVSNSTIVNNTSAPGGGDGISIDFSSANSKVTINSSIINANGTNDLLDNGTNMNVVVNSSLIGNAAGFTIDSTDGNNLAPGTDPNLKALGNYGGPTQTHEPNVGSPVLDKGTNPLALSLDQRGGARSFGDPDMGSVEVFAIGAPTAAATVSNITKSGGNKLSFTVTYNDDALMDGSTIGTGDIRVTGPGGYNVIATYTGGPQADAKSIVASYEIPANTTGSPNWDALDNGTYNIRVEPGQVKDKSGNNVPSGTISSFTVAAPRPIGLPQFGNVTTPATDFTFQVIWVGDTTKISLATLGNDDVRVKNTALGFDAAATFVSADKGADDTTIIATYKVTGPGGSWDIAGERGQLFTVEAQADKVLDVDGTGVALGSVGQFAAFLIVDSTSEVSDGDFSPGNYSLREAIDTANATAHSNDVVTFDATAFSTPQTIFVSSRLAITGGMKITGPTAQVTIDGAGVSALMSITGVGGRQTDVVLEKLRFANGTAQFGAGIDSDGAVVTLNNVIFQDLIGTQGIGIRVRNSIGATMGGLIANNSTWNNADCTASVAAGNYFGGAAMVVDTDFGTFNNCTFINNDAINPAADGTYFGAAIAIRAVNLTIANTIFTSNIAEGFGGAIGAIMSGTTTITGSTFTNNSSQTSSGGAILHQGTSPSVTITGTSFTGNTAPAGTGGAVNIQAGTAGSNRLVENCTFTNNQAGASGGALAILDNTIATVRNSVFVSNKANTALVSSGGGAISFQGVTAKTTVRVIEGSTFENNESVLATGGAITHFAGGTVFLRNSTLSGNKAATDGSAIRLVSAGVGAADFQIQNTTIAFNNATAGVTISQANPAANGTLSIESSIVAKNTFPGSGDITSGTTVTLTNSLIGNGDGTTFVQTGTNFVGTTLTPEDPGFVGGLASNGATQPGNKTYAISTSSKVYNTGSNPASLTTDQRGAGFNRVSGGTADMGAFELQVAAPPPTITSIKVDDGSGQRSLVRSLVVTFNEPVNFSSTSFQLTQYFNGTGTVGLVLSPTTGPASSVTITFDNSGTVALNPNGSLPDGKFELRVVANNVSSGSGTLDGNGNGTAQGSPTDDRVQQFHRLFGDADGNGNVNAADFAQFRSFFGLAGPSIFDFNGDNNTTAADFAQFRGRFGLGGFAP